MVKLYLLAIAQAGVVLGQPVTLLDPATIPPGRWLQEGRARQLPAANNGNNRHNNRPLSCTAPGPTIEAWQNQQVTVNWINKLPQDAHVLGNVVDPVTLPMDFTGPTVRIIPHLHGGHTQPNSDGYPEGWWSSGVNGTAQQGPAFKGTTFRYGNTQLPSTIWYHDHAIGITRLNVYAGLAGFWLIRNQREIDLRLPSGKYEIPIAIQDRAFKTDFQLFYPEQLPLEFFGDVALVNGKVWPNLAVDHAQYRLRLLNGCNARFLRIWLEVLDTAKTIIPFRQIGAEGGLFTAPVTYTGLDTANRLVFAPGERADIIVDFSGLAAGTKIIVHNDAPTPFTNFGDAQSGVALPTLFQITVNGKLLINNTPFDAPNDVFVPLNAIEKWRFINLTPDTHPMHIHLVQFQVLTRDGPIPGNNMIQPNEVGAWKDTVQVPPGGDETFASSTTVIAKFDIKGLYVFHCHILEHEDFDMMRPFQVGPPPGRMLRQ